MASAGDNGWPPDGDLPEGLRGLPEEWGVIVVPDDLSELSDEVDAIRAELHPTPPPTGLRRLARRPGVRRLCRAARLVLRTPALIVSLALLVTVASLFASAWPGPVRQSVPQRTAGTAGVAAGDRGETLPALGMIGADGQEVSLRERLPVVVLLVDGCDCAGLIAETVAAVRADTAVVTVAATPASARDAASASRPQPRPPQAEGKTVRHLQDRTGTLRDHLRLAAPDGTAAVLLVNRSGRIVRTWVRTASVDEFRADLARLGSAW